MEYSKDRIPIVNILIKKNENGSCMDPYHKPIDTQRFLPFTFNHPNHRKRNILFCLAQRICTIAGEIKEFGKLKIKFTKIQLPGFANNTRITESPLNTTKRLTKT